MIIHIYYIFFYISLLIIPCIIYYVTNKETLIYISYNTQKKSKFLIGQISTVIYYYCNNTTAL